MFYTYTSLKWQIIVASSKAVSVTCHIMCDNSICMVSLSSGSQVTCICVIIEKPHGICNFGSAKRSMCVVNIQSRTQFDSSAWIQNTVVFFPVLYLHSSPQSCVCFCICSRTIWFESRVRISVWRRECNATRNLWAFAIDTVNLYWKPKPNRRHNMVIKVRSANLCGSGGTRSNCIHAILYTIHCVMGVRLWQRCGVHRKKIHSTRTSALYRLAYCQPTGIVCYTRNNNVLRLCILRRFYWMLYERLFGDSERILQRIILTSVRMLLVHKPFTNWTRALWLSCRRQRETALPAALQRESLGFRVHTIVNWSREQLIILIRTRG